MKAAIMNDELKTSNAYLNSLLESDGFYQSLFRKLPVALYMCDRDGHITFYNEAAVELWGREPVPGKDSWCGSSEMYHLDGTPLPLEECPVFIALKEGRIVAETEIIISRPDGTRRYVQPSPQPVFDKSGQIAGVVNQLTDITDRKLVEERMAHLAAIVSSSDDAIISKTLDGTITSWNNGAERIFGYTAAEIVGQPVTTLIPVDRLEEEPAIIERMKRGERIDHFETKRITKNKKILDISLTISPIKSSDGRIIGASKIARDITDQKAAEKLIAETKEKFKDQLEKKVEQRTSELVHINEELERSNYELEQYAYIASHDLQEPLRKIQTFAELLKINLHDAAAVESYYNKISVSAKRMSSLIKDVLNYSKLAKSDYTFGPVDLNQVLQDVKSDFEVLIEQKRAVIETVGGKLPAVKGDAQQLRQLFANLLSNSLKFSEENPYIQLQATLVDLPAHANGSENISGHYVELIFKDNGIGFEQKYADQIFVVFKRLNNRQLYSGTGIGLAVCKRIVERHGGLISVSSEPGKGTTFTILLPVAAA